MPNNRKPAVKADITRDLRGADLVQSILAEIDSLLGYLRKDPRDLLNIA